MHYLPYFLCISLCVSLILGCDDPSHSDLEWTLEETRLLEKSPLFFVDTSQLYQDEEFRSLVRTALRQWVAKPVFAEGMHTDWAFGEGDPSLGLSVAISQKPEFDSLVDLPHKIAKPNWPLWYEKTVLNPESRWLYIKGDDGVQVFWDGKPISSHKGQYFKIPASPDALTLSIRVLNNAMGGGLQKVFWINDDAFQSYQEQYEIFGYAQQLLWHYWQQPEKVLAAEIINRIEQKDTSKLEAILGVFPPLLPTNMPDLHTTSDTTFSFTAWGDSQGGWRTFQHLIDHMQNSADAFSIGLGDLVANGIEEQQWISFQQCLQPLLAVQPVFSIAGNHDYDGYYKDLIPLLYKEQILPEGKERTYFSWVYGNAFFLALDPNEAFPLSLSGQQTIWMEEQLNSPAWENAQWHFVLIHQPPYAQGWPGYHGDDFVREFIEGKAAEKKIDFVLSGHTHDYERLAKDFENQVTHCFVLGGAGGSLEPEESSDFPKMDLIRKEHHFARFKVKQSDIEIKIINLEGQVVDSLLVSK